MRTIPSALQTLLDSDDGQEFLVALEIFWDGNKNGTGKFYATKAIGGTQIAGKILAMDDIDEVIQISQGGQSAGMSVLLDDTDGDIKSIFDVNDIHKIPVRAWFHMLDTDFDVDKARVFFGQISSPVEWSEGGRSLSFKLENRIEDTEVGFSAEEGNFSALPEELIGKVWPFCTGTTINVPALQAVPSVSGTLAEGVGIKDFTLDTRLLLAEALSCPQTPVGLKCVTRVSASRYEAVCRTVLETDVGCLQARCVEIERLTLRISEEEALEFPTITIFDGELFPQGRTLTLNIDGGLFEGFFDGSQSNPTNEFTIKERQHPDYDPDAGRSRVNEQQEEIESKCPNSETDAGDSDLTQTSYGPIFTGARTSRLSWEAYRGADKANFFFARGGSKVFIDQNNEILHIANIVPSTIKRVAAWRTLQGTPFLLSVPEDKYTIRETDYGPQNMMEVVLDRPLSLEDKDTGGGWSDTLYISQVSSVGSNTVTIMEHLISTYTDYTTDAASFADVKAKVAKYPMDFALLRRPTILTILQELAKLARCALWQKDDVFYIKYLAETPTPVATITQDDVLADDTTKRGTLKIRLTKTEDLVTKLTAKWVKDYAAEKENTVIVRHNVKGQYGIKYGTHEKEEDYFAFSHLQLVKKSATFWLTRQCNTWKKLRFNVSLEFLKLEPFDAVTIDLPEVASETFVGIVERAKLNVAQRHITLDVWTPIRSGELTPYDFAHPAGISANAIFPTAVARSRGEAGSGNLPNFTTIAPPGHPLRSSTTGLFRGVTLACNGRALVSFISGECRQDHGDSRPSDIDDVKPTTDIPEDATGLVSSGTSPITDGAGDGFWSLTQQIQEWNELEDGNTGRTRENGLINSDEAGAYDDQEPIDSDRDFLDELPDPDDLDPQLEPCQYWVSVTGFGTVEGFKNLCFPQLPARTEIYVYDSLLAAEAFCESLWETSNCGSNQPCTQCISSCLITNNSTDECTDDGAGDLIAFRGSTNPDYDDTSFMDEATAE
jgi:hypothetical protein